MDQAVLGDGGREDVFGHTARSRGILFPVLLFEARRSKTDTHSRPLVSLEEIDFELGSSSS